MRTIITEKDISKAKAARAPGEAAPSAGDEYKDRLLKYIPAEVVSVYVFVNGLVQNSTAADTTTIIWAVFGLMLIGTPLYLWRIENVTKKVQLGVSTGAFVVWAMAIGGAFLTIAWYQPIYGQILLPIYTFFVAIIKPEG